MMLLLVQMDIGDNHFGSFCRNHIKTHLLGSKYTKNVERRAQVVPQK